MMQFPDPDADAARRFAREAQALRVHRSVQGCLAALSVGLLGFLAMAAFYALKVLGS